ncbi:hypothetical protein [Methylophilus medardicus]|uniref:Uncharacterized protein n=1 Tax=Methylophilus medardicus TaxID=2588534 RepID=A0A5B8CVM9_9PROT|nr:hypothetical protein [Methylophilus medardicus]QDC45342.1 hypothetical protein FIU01_05515 [Methylophilus medardicus]QDC50349.1 hypothetical protein FIU00_05515 [Methylophilus medardicus]QDC54054.1 hypothetical protein FIT99_05515 [Methylophilus medardicus]
MIKRLRTRRHPARPTNTAALETASNSTWPQMLLWAIGLAALIAIGVFLGWDTRVLAGVAVLVGLVSGLFVWMLGLIAVVPLIGPLIVKVLSFSFIWLLNALGYLVSYVAIRRGYSRDVLTYRGLTMALLIGIVIGYVVAQFI